MHTLSDFDFVLPEQLIAQHPAPERSGSRLLDGRAPTPVDRVFRELPALLQPGDLLVFNDTRVVKARVFGEKASGGKLELLIERVLTGNDVVAHMKVSKKPLPGATVHMAGGAARGGEQPRAAFIQFTHGARRAIRLDVSQRPPPMACTARGSSRCGRV